MTRSQEAEDARSAVNLSLGQTRMVISALNSAFPDGRWTASADESSLYLTGIATIVSHVELFMILRTIEHTLTGVALLPKGAADKILESYTQNAESSWDGRLDIVRQWTGTSLKMVWKEWQAWHGFINARNAWAHGQGLLTRRQRSDKSLETAFRRAGLALVDDRLVADEAALARCAAFGIELIDLSDSQ